MNKIELLAPAGDLEKLKIAYMYGADAVYVGGKSFSLRARASNFTYDDIKCAGQIANEMGKKLYITMNIIPHDNDLSGLDEYLMFLESAHVTGIICSSEFIAKKARAVAPKLEVHLSTQMSVSNSLAIKHYENLGFSRVVLAREVSLENIKKIKENTNCELEVFIHGGMCSSYSGRCMLSNYLTSRDANRGGCAHSCRWNYDVYENGNKVNNNILNIGSKDLNATHFIKELINLNVASLKIEGRMKSIYYLATIIKAYRKLIDDVYNNIEIDYNKTILEISKAENRLTSIGFLNGDVTKEEMLYNNDSCAVVKDFLGIVLNYEDNIVTLQQRNNFKSFDEVEFFGPNLPPTTFVIPNEIIDKNGQVITYCPHPLEEVKFYCNIKLSKYDMMRKK